MVCSGSDTCLFRLLCFKGHVLKNFRFKLQGQVNLTHELITNFLDERANIVCAINHDVRYISQENTTEGGTSMDNNSFKERKIATNSLLKN